MIPIASASTTAAGRRFPLSQVARVETRLEEPLIKRYNRRIALNVRGDTAPGVQPDTAAAALDALLQAIRAALPPGYTIDISGTPEENAKANAAIGALGPVTLIAMLSQS